VTALYVAAESFLCLLALVLVRMIEVHFLFKLLVLVPLLLAGGVFFVSLVKVLARPREGEMTGEKVNLLDINVNALSMELAVARIESFIRSREPHMVVTSDASAIVRSQSDEQLHDIINTADLVTPDGIGVIWSARLLDLPLYERVSGVDLALALCSLCREKGYSLFLVGAAPGVADEAADKLKERFPGLRIAGTRHGFFTTEEEPEIVRLIREARPDILLVALGIPRQEKWIKRHLQELQVPVCIGVGGSLDVYAGRVPRAPEWVQRLGMEWLYRTARDPRRLGRMLLLPRLIFLTLQRRMTQLIGSRV
jgi:N-acetylglucosaminyldiphosphoundecaprenol N-acetyl-beta-D-mannosaminyltransferase